jgi:hypothetical protein
MLSLRSLITKTKQKYCNRMDNINRNIKISDLMKMQQRSNNLTRINNGTFKPEIAAEMLINLRQLKITMTHIKCLLAI